jgi:hypothetical protein
MADLCTVALARQHADKATGGSDETWQAIVSGVSAWVCTAISRDLASQQYVVALNGAGGMVQTLPQYPVTSVASVVVDGQAIPQSADALQPGWVQAGVRSLALRGGYRFARGYANVVVTYTAGYAEIPSDVQLVAARLAALTYVERSRVGMTSQQVQNEQIQYAYGQLPARDRQTLEQYRNVVPA